MPNDPSTHQEKFRSYCEHYLENARFQTRFTVETRSHGQRTN